jgi:hypothetical protein
MIDRFDTEVKTTDNRWVKLWRMDTVGWKPFSETKLPNIFTPIDAMFIDRQIIGQTMPPKGVARGWVFYDYPESADPATSTRTLRVTVEDFSGNMFVADPVPSISSTVQDMQYAITGKSQDLRKFEKTNHCGIPW